MPGYRQGQLDLVRTSLPGVVKPAALTVGERAVYAALLKQNGGDAGNVFRLVERIPPLVLLPEEKVFLTMDLWLRFSVRLVPRTYGGGGSRQHRPKTAAGHERVLAQQP